MNECGGCCPSVHTKDCAGSLPYYALAVIHCWIRRAMILSLLCWFCSLHYHFSTYSSILKISFQQGGRTNQEMVVCLWKQSSFLDIFGILGLALWSKDAKHIISCDILWPSTWLCQTPASTVSIWGEVFQHFPGGHDCVPSAEAHSCVFVGWSMVEQFPAGCEKKLLIKVMTLLSRTSKGTSAHGLTWVLRSDGGS